MPTFPDYAPSHPLKSPTHAAQRNARVDCPQPHPDRSPHSKIANAGRRRRPPHSGRPAPTSGAPTQSAATRPAPAGRWPPLARHRRLSPPLPTAACPAPLRLAGDHLPHATAGRRHCAHVGSRSLDRIGGDVFGNKVRFPCRTARKSRNPLLISPPNLRARPRACVRRRLFPRLK
ncbi:uncharacterized protein LOC121053821 [Oryza brachyantha]|uniref:uncharacterized protein LOC121053821 n=1 Tax=Oryza brachyantha TaxID=4533 RepID=UPI001ADAD7F6|nr:uncharacterized protein LOC121053821 [Oryza brachyantha]